MHICIIGKHEYPKDIFSNEQDMKTWRGMSAYFENLFVIASSPDLFFHSAKEKNINIYLIPNILGYIGFIIGAVKFGLYLNWHYNVDVFDASEIAGGGIAVTILKFFTRKPTVIEVQGEVFRRPLNTNTRIYTNDTNKKNVKYSCYSHVFYYSYYYKNKLLQGIGRFVMKRAARIRVISNAIFNQVLDQGVPESKIRLVSLRVDLALFDPNRFGESIRQTLYTGDKSVDNTIIIGYLGRVVNGKGLEDFFVAISKLKLQIPSTNLRVLIFGVGPLEVKLKKIASDLSIGNKITWMGFLPYSRVPEAFSEMDIFVYPSWHEGFGRSIMEALAMKKAVVATRVGGILDLIKDGKNGFLVEPNNPNMMAEKIKELAQNKELREKFGKAGREWVSENFEWNQGIKKFAQLFLELRDTNIRIHTNDTNNN